MAAPESNTTVILATARAQVDGVLSAYKVAQGSNTDKAAAPHLAATIETLTRAMAVLGEAVVMSAGFSPPKTPVLTKGPQISATVAPLDDSALAEGRRQPRNDEGT